MTDKKKKKKKKFSILRVIIGLIVGFIIIAALLQLDYHLENLPHYRDISPVSSPDGSFVVFVRLYQNTENINKFDICKVDSDGNNFTRLFSSPTGFTVFGIRRLLVSGDNKSINLRLNRKINDEIEDYLFRIPIDSPNEIEKWKLDKKFPYDAFLAYKDDHVALRRMREPGKMSPNKLLICRFSTREKILEFDFPEKGTACVFADFYGENPKLYGLVHKLEVKNPGDNECFFYLFNENIQIGYNLPILAFKYLYKKREFLGSGMNKDKDFHVYNLEKGEWSLVPNPAGKDDKTDYLVSGDENRLIVYNRNTFFFDSLDKEEKFKLTIPEGFICGADIFPDGQTVVYSDSEAICKINENTQRKLTEISEKSAVLKNKAYRNYLEFRHKLIYNSDTHH